LREERSRSTAVVTLALACGRGLQVDGAAVTDGDERQEDLEVPATGQAP
jgi:hypothetical protein